MSRVASRRVGVLVVIALTLAPGCGDEPRHPDANSAHAARACVAAVRADSGDAAADVENPNHASIDGGAVTAPFVVDGAVATYRCAFAFDIETQRYTVTSATRIDP